MGQTSNAACKTTNKAESNEGYPYHVLSLETLGQNISGMEKGVDILTGKSLPLR